MQVGLNFEELPRCVWRQNERDITGRQRRGEAEQILINERAVII